MSTATAVEILRLAAGTTAAPTSANDAEMTIEACLLSGAPIDRQDYTNGAYTLIIDPVGVDLSRVKAGTCALLDSHSSWSVDSQLGTIIDVRPSKGKLMGTLKFFPSAEQVFLDSKAAKRGVSVGLIILEYKDEVDASGQLIRRTVTKSQIYEVSLVAVPADVAAVTLSMEKTMNTITHTEQTAAGAAVVTLSEIDKQAIRDRVRIANLPAALGEQFITNNLPPDQASNKIFDELARLDSLQPQTRGHVAFADGHRDYYDGRRDLMLEGLVARLTGKMPSDGAREFAAMRMADLARELNSMSNRWSGKRASDAKEIEFSLTTGDLPQFLTDTSNRMIVDAYHAAESDIKKLARRSTANDYRKKTSLKMSQPPELLKVNEHGEVKSGSVSESGETYAVADYARIISFTQAALVNDNLGVLTDFARQFGTAAATKEADLLVGLITANSGAGPAMSDTVNLFHATHKNLGTAAALSIDTLSEARTLMRLQTDLDGKTIVGVQPQFLLVPAKLETKAEQLLAQLAAASTADVNPFSGRLTLVVEPRLDAKSVTRHYIFGDPTAAPVLEYSYLSGSEGVQVTSRTGFEVLGVEFRAVLTFGCGVIDWRGAVANAGA